MHLIPLHIVAAVAIIALVSYIIGFWMGWESQRDPKTRKYIDDLEKKYGTNK